MIRRISQACGYRLVRRRLRWPTRHALLCANVAEWRTPWLAFTITAVLLTTHAAANSHGGSDVLTNLIFNKEAFRAGQYWRLLTYMVRHLDWQHVLEDSVYAAVVVTLCERTFGSGITLIVFLTCGIGGAVGFLMWDIRYSSLAGSSCGTHGLFACYGLWYLFNAKNGLQATLAVLQIAYLFYTSITAILTGYMAWPLGMLSNPGYDHLCGVSAGIIWACVLRRKALGEY